MSTTVTIDTATLQSLLSTLNQLTAALHLQTAPAASAPTQPAPGGGAMSTPAGAVVTQPAPPAAPQTALAAGAVATAPLVQHAAGTQAPDPSTLAAQLATRSTSLHPGNQFEPWYVVTKGKAPGVYYDVTEVNPLTISVRRACSHKAASQAEALAAYTRAWDRGDVEVIV